MKQKQKGGKNAERTRKKYTKRREKQKFTKYIICKLYKRHF